MSDMTIEQFCDKHRACKDGRDWAIANCESMQDAWMKLKIEWLLWVATRNGVLSNTELRLFAVWCARQIQHLMTDPRSIAAIDVAERYAEGKATDAELAAARSAAWAAAAAASWAVAAAEAAAASWAVARSAPWTAARSASWAAAAARSASWAEALAAARNAQADWLRRNCHPNFQEEAKP